MTTISAENDVVIEMKIVLAVLVLTCRTTWKQKNETDTWLLLGSQESAAGKILLKR